MKIQRELLSTTSVAAMLMLGAWQASAGGSIKDRPATAASSLAGIYVGAAGGYGWGRSNQSRAGSSVQGCTFDAGVGLVPGDAEYQLCLENALDLFNIGTDPSEAHVRTSGGLFGGTLGYNIIHSRLLLGVEGDYSAAWMKGSAPCGDGTCSVELQNFGTLRLRLGHDLGGGLFGYVTGGLAAGDLKVIDSAFARGTRWHTGWTAGGGLEKAIDHRWSVKLEYLYTDLGERAHFQVDGNVHKADFSASVIRLGINIRPW